MAIDIHAHYLPPALLAAIADQSGRLDVTLLPGPSGATPAIAFANGFKTRPLFPKLIEAVETRAAWMTTAGLAHQFVATWPDMYGYCLAPDACAAWHALLNTTLAAWTSLHRERFSWVCSVPLPNAADAAATLDHAAAAGAVAAMISANVEGTNIGELALDALWHKAEALEMPIIIHPLLVQPAPRAAKFGLTQIVQYTFDTTLGFGSLLFSGVLDRFPKLRFVLSHGGGAVPYLNGRFDVMHRRMDRAGQGDVAIEAPSAYLNRVACDSIVHDPRALRFLADCIGIENVLLGSDYSFPPADLDPLSTLTRAGFDKDEIEMVCETNVHRLFARFGTA